MRNRLWIVVLLMVWIGQWMVGLIVPLPLLRTSGPDPYWSEDTETVSMAGPSPVLRTPWWEGWLAVEDLAARVVRQARRRGFWFWPSSRSHGRGGKCRGKGRGKKRPSRRLVTPPGQGEEEPEPEQPSHGPPNCRSDSVFAPRRWGLSPELSRGLPERLAGFWQRYADCFKTKTRDTSEYAYHYLSGLLRMETKRNYTNIGRMTGVAGENIQHFMSNSPWLARMVLEQVRREIEATPGLERGGVLLLDESADEKAGDKSAGAGRQRNGRLGKVEMSVVGTLLAYANLTHPERPVWTWVDGELYLQEQWFTSERADRRQRVGIPSEREFETKIEQGWKMIQRARAEGLPFEAVAFDDLYGRSKWLRDKTAEAQIIYMADVPRNTQVYLEKPVLGVPAPVPGRPGPKPTRLRVLNGAKPFEAHQVARRADTTWKHVRVRSIERGELNDPFAIRRIWTLREGESEPVEEWLVVRREAKNRRSYALSNAPAEASLEYLAWLKCQRYFVERANQDAKSEAGWDELQAQKYRGWEHHLALVILATWFVAQTKWEWAQEYARDPALAQQLAVEVLPALSMANVRLLLRAAMPLPQPTPEEAVTLVVEHFVNRTRSRKSRLNRQRVNPTANAPP